MRGGACLAILRAYIHRDINPGRCSHDHPQASNTYGEKRICFVCKNAAAGKTRRSVYINWSILSMFWVRERIDMLRLVILFLCMCETRIWYVRYVGTFMGGKREHEIGAEIINIKWLGWRIEQLNECAVCVCTLGMRFQVDIEAAKLRTTILYSVFSIRRG